MAAHRKQAPWKLINLGVILPALALLGHSMHLLAAASNVSVQVCDPAVTLSILSPADGTVTNNNSVVVSGYGPALSSVAAFRNHSQVGAVTSSSDGSYSLSVPLVQGNNLLYARHTNACSYTAQSNAVNVTRQTGRSAPTTNTTTSAKPTMVSPQDTNSPDKAASISQQTVIVEPKDGTETTTPTVYLRGKAQPDARIRLRLNGQVVAEITANEDGEFAGSVSLVEGKNILQANTISGQDEVSSNTINVTYKLSAAFSTVTPGSSTNFRWWLIAASGVVLFIAGWMARHHHKPKLTTFSNTGTPHGYA